MITWSEAPVGRLHRVMILYEADGSNESGVHEPVFELLEGEQQEFAASCHRRLLSTLDIAGRYPTDPSPGEPALAAAVSLLACICLEAM